MSEAENKVDEVKIEDVIELSDSSKGEIEELEPLNEGDLVFNEQGDFATVVSKAIDETVQRAQKPSDQIVSAATANKEIVEQEEAEDEFLDETLTERLWGLTEMFPESVRKASWTLSTGSISCIKSLYQLSRSVVWIITTSAIILAAPAIIENEKSQLDEMNRQQQRQILLGPSASMPSGSGLTPSLTPPQPAR